MSLLPIIAVGLGVGFAGGLFGIGGSIVLIPALTELLGPDQHRYQAAAMIVNFFVAVPAVYQHRRASAIERGTVIRIVPLALVAVLIGVGISELGFFAGEGETYLRALFGGFLFFSAAMEFRRYRRGDPIGQDLAGSHAGDRPPGVSHWRSIVWVAIPTGIAAGLLGIGGGIVAVPLQRRFLNIPLRQAIANSATLIIATSLVGATAKNYAYAMQNGRTFDALILAAVVVPTAIIGSMAGSRLTHKLPIRLLKGMFIILLLIAGIRFSYTALRSLPTSPPQPRVAFYEEGRTSRNATDASWAPFP